MQNVKSGKSGMFTFPPPPFPVSCSWIRHPTLSDLYARHLDFKIMMRFYKKNCLKCTDLLTLSLNLSSQPAFYSLAALFRKRHICITALPHQLTPWQTSVEAATPRNKIQGRREASIWKDGTYPATSGPASERFQGGYFSLNISIFTEMAPARPRDLGRVDQPRSKKGFTSSDSNWILKNLLF